MHAEGPIVNARATLAHVLQSEHSDFYRNKYREDITHVRAISKGAHTWTSLPFLTREEIQRTSLSQRSFIPYHALDMIRVTSGTSSRGIIPLPRMANDFGGYQSRFDKAYLHARAVTNMATFSGAQLLYAKHFREHFGLDSLHLDPSDMHMSAALCTRYQPDVLSTFPYTLLSLMPVLPDAVKRSVRVVILFGEWCSQLQWELFQRTFPNALVALEYASIESQTTIAGPCRNIIDSGERFVHTYPDLAHAEVIDPDTHEPITAEGVRGELVITVTRPVAFPLIRYRTGDMARIVHTHCGCEIPTSTIAIDGRLLSDRLRIPGGELNTAEFDRVLTKHQHYLTGSEFTVQYHETTVSEGVIRPQVSVRCAWDTERISADELSRRVARELRVGPGYSYADKVVAGAFAPLTVVFEHSPDTAKKRIRIVRADR